MAPKSSLPGLALAAALLLPLAAPVVAAHSLLAPGDPRLLTLRDGWPHELRGTYVFVGGDVDAEFAGAETGGRERFCWRAGTDRHVGPSEECWRQDEGEALGDLIVPGEIILGAVVMGRPYCVVMIKDGQPRFPCCAFLASHGKPCTLPRPDEAPALLA